MTIYLINETPDEWATYKADGPKAELYARAVEIADPGCRRCTKEEFDALERRIDAVDGVKRENGE